MLYREIDQHDVDISDRFSNFFEIIQEDESSPYRRFGEVGSNSIGPVDCRHLSEANMGDLVVNISPFTLR